MPSTTAALLLATICVLDAGDAKEAAARLGEYSQDVRIIAASANRGECDIAVLPSGFAQAGWDDIAPQLPSLSKWVREGGGLLVFQPNPYPEDKFPGGKLTLDLLDAPLTVDNWYQSGESVTRIREHPLTEGLDGKELPFPHDRIVAFENGPWKALARGVSSGDDSLLVGEFKEGRAVVWAGNPNVANGEGVLLSRVVSWLATAGD